MRPQALLAWVGLLAGCDLVFPLAADAPAVDANTDTGMVHGTWTRRTAVNRSDGTPVVSTATTNPEAVHYEAHAMDGTRRPVVVTNDGSFTFTVPTPGARYRLQRSDALETVELQDDAPELSVVRRTLGRVDRVTSFDDPVIHFPPAGPVGPTSTTTIASTGLWTETAVGASPTTPWDFHWNTATPLPASGPLGLLDADHFDRLYYVGFEQQTATVPMQITSAGVAMLSIPTNRTIEFEPTPVALEPICVSLTTGIVAERERVQILGGSAYSPPSSDWRLGAVPDFAQLGTLGSLLLARDVQMTDLTNVPFQFANPYAGSTVIASMGVSAERDYRLPEADIAIPAVRAGLGTRYVQRVASAAPSGCPAVALAGGLQIVDQVDLDGARIADGALVQLASRPTIDATWHSVGSVAPDFYEVVLDELLVEGTTSTAHHALAPRAKFVTDTAKLAIPTALLLPGHYYVLAITGSLGYPGITEGKYGPSDPQALAQTFATGPYFQVTP